MLNALRLEEYSKNHSSKHPFLDNDHPLEIPMNVHPLAAIMGQIEKAKNEMELVRKVLNDVRAQGGTNPDFRENRRWIPSK